MSVSGNRALRSRSFDLLTRPGQPLSDSLLELDRQGIAARCIEQGFLWADVRCEKVDAPKGIEVRFHVSENEPARLGSLRLLGSRMIARPRLRPALMHRGPGFRPQDPSDNARALVRFYADNGFPFCQIQVESLTESRPQVSYVLVIDEGPEVRLSDVRFSGRFETKPALLKRILNLGLNQPYSETETRSSMRQLTRDPLVLVRGFAIRTRDRDYWLEIMGSERRSNRASGLLGYSSPESELMGSLSLNLGNLFGTRRAFKLEWRRSRERQDLSAVYTEPWLLGTVIAVTAGARNRFRDSSFSATELRLGARAGIARYLSLGLDGAYSFEASGIAALPPSRTTWLGTSLGLDSRDQPANPGQGLSGGVFIDVGTRRSADSIRSTIARSRIECDAHFPLAARWHLSLGGRAWGAFSPDVVYAYDLFELGGAASLRGFREDEFRTDRCTWAFVELRWRLTSLGRVYPFFDLALVHDPELNRYGWHSGYGAGLRLETGIGQFGLDYGIRTGSSPLRGKVHLSVQAAF